MKHKIIKRQYISRNCFVCGIYNNAGLQAKFYETDKGEVIGVVSLASHHQSYPGRVHGGISSALLDEIIGRAISIGKDENIWGVTLDLSLKYRKPVPYDEEIKVIGRVTNDMGRMYIGTAEIVLADGQTAVSAEGRYLKQSAEKISGEGFDEDSELAFTDETVPEEIEI